MKAAEIFQENYQSYCSQIATLDLSSIYKFLGAELEEERLQVSFFNQPYIISKEGIVNIEGNRPSYLISVILAKYILLCPGKISEELEWVSFKDFKSDAYRSVSTDFTTSADRAIKKHFSGRLDELRIASKRLGGARSSIDVSYELAVEFRALPRISILLLFNDKDEEFAANAKILYQKQAEHYLDPESLVMTVNFLAERLIKKA